MASASDQPFNSAMLAEGSTQPGAGTVGLNITGAPWRCVSAMGWPCSLKGVWQSLHIPSFSTRYSPRFTCAEEAVFFGVAEPAFCANVAETTASRHTPPNRAALFMNCLLKLKLERH